MSSMQINRLLSQIALCMQSKRCSASRLAQANQAGATTATSSFADVLKQGPA